MKIKEFAVERWMNDYENEGEYNLAETCVDSLTVREILSFEGDPDEEIKKLLDIRLTYGDIYGSDDLRAGISDLYENVKPENITITHGAIGANFLTIYSLVKPGDHVISVLPTYQQMYSIPESLGADVSILRLHWENNFLPDIDELKSMVKDNTSLICINNPNNPTGALMSDDILDAIIEIAEECDAYILCDEVYRGLNHHGSGFAPSIADKYHKGISTGSFSKVFSLAGIRLGWAAANSVLTEKMNMLRDYNTISCGMIDDYIAAIAIKNKEKILKRNHSIVRGNIEILDEWMSDNKYFSYIRPQAGTTALLKMNFDMQSREFCIKLIEKTGVILVPGSCFDMEGYIRIGYSAHRGELIKGLKLMSEFLHETIK